MKPINYYIQLSPQQSEMIDAMSKDDLVIFSQHLLSVYHDSFWGARTVIYKDVILVLCTNEIIQLAYGCLAKATAM